MLLPQRTPNRGAGSFRPALEVLEDRTVLSSSMPPISFSNPMYISTLNEFATAINAANTQVNNLTDQFDNDLATFAKNPQSVNALTSLIADTQQLGLAVGVLQQEADLFDGAVLDGEAFGLIKGPETISFDIQRNGFESNAFNAFNTLQGASNRTVGAIIDFISNVPTDLQPLPTTQPSTSPSSPTGTFSETVNAPPATYPSDARTPPSCSVTVTNPDNTPRTVTVSYSDTLGNRTSQSDVCTNSTITVTDAGTVCPPGQSGTFVVSVTGQPDQKFTVNFQ
jgi:hypothetical protein